MRCAGCLSRSTGPPAMHGKGVEMSHELYIQALSAMFLFWNGVRILTYLPTIGKLLAREADVRSHSLLSWGSWALSNGTFALMLLEMSRGIPNGMFWMNLANTLMCAIVSLIILFRRFPRLHTSVSKVFRKTRRNDSSAGAVSRRLELLHLGAGNLAIGANLAIDPVPAPPPTRFGRPELWVAFAIAVAFGIVGAVTYDAWPNHHQSAYVESKASTQQVLGKTAPASPTQQLSSSGPVTPSTAPPAPATVIATTVLAPPTPSTSFERRTAPSRGSAAPRPAAGRPGKAGNGVPQNRGNWASHFMASVRQALGFPRSTPPKRQRASPGRGVPSSSATSRGTAVSRAEIAQRAPSAPLDHSAAASREGAAPQFASGRPGRTGHFATQDRLRSARHVPVYAAPPTVVSEAAHVVYEGSPVVYQEPPVAYAQAPVAYGHGYEGEYRDRRRWHDNGWHKGWKHRQQEEDD
ncbi:hypothetical protein AWB68_05840 [Caballeronia choica]|uniref:Uncharacterized protein n=1 Tax=Caballeronia choica TaxID=326476 RepID=A0A158KH75_9BURK|nr:hypothetical protein AWB68_05840 [Caballeronia choica]